MILPISRRLFLRLGLVAIAAFLTLVASSSVSGLPPAQSGPVPVFLLPASTALAGGGTVTLEIRVGASSGQPVDTVQAFLDFDQTVLQVVDGSGNPTTSINPGTIITNGTWKSVIRNDVDNNAGRIQFVASKSTPGGPQGSNANFEFQLATVRFQRVAASACTNVSFDVTPPGPPGDGTPETKAVFEAANVTGIVTDATVVSVSGNWNIDQDCTIVGTTPVQAPADVIVEPGATLTVAAGATLDIKLDTNRLLIQNGGRVVIKDGGKID